jgi:NTP pyrophosphatase (non-canonical NTP hydrolase)
MSERTILYRPTGQRELEMVAASGWKRWPPRLPEQPIFYPVTNEHYAIEIAQRWNTRDAASGHIGHVTRFAVCSEFLARFETKQVGDGHHLEYWIPAEDLEALNDNIVGHIARVRSFGGPDGCDAEFALDQLKAAIFAFAEERDWLQFHTPKNLSMAIASEAADLMELFLWSQGERTRKLGDKRAAFEEELADVLIYALELANVTGTDVSRIIRRKMARNAARYPVELARGNARKYTEFGCESRPTDS